MSDTLIRALLGAEPSALRDDVTLATPLTLPRIIGRDQVAAALRGYADVLGAADADLRLAGGGLEGAVFTTTIDGHTAQVLALVSRDAAGLISAIDLYGRPWPYMALVRDQLGRSHPELTDPDLGSVPYVPEGPGTGWIDAPPLPPLAEDVSFYSPLLDRRRDRQARQRADPAGRRRHLRRAEVPRHPPGRRPQRDRGGVRRRRRGQRAAAGRYLRAERPGRDRRDPDLQPPLAGYRVLPGRDVQAAQRHPRRRVLAGPKPDSAPSRSARARRWRTEPGGRPPTQNRARRPRLGPCPGAGRPALSSSRRRRQARPDQLNAVTTWRGRIVIADGGSLPRRGDGLIVALVEPDNATRIRTLTALLFPAVDAPTATVWLGSLPRAAASRSAASITRRSSRKASWTHSSRP